MKSKEEIFALENRDPEPVNIPEWGGEVHVRTLTALEGDRLSANWRKLGRPAGDYAGFRAWVVAHTVMNGSGLFFDPVADFEKLNDQRTDIIGKLFDKACQLNALTKSDQEELVKN